MGVRPLSEPAILTARAAPDILVALARATWHKAHDGALCPAEAIPTPAALAEWLHDCPEAAFVEATARLNAMTAGAAEWVWTVNRPLPGLSAPDMTPEVIAHDGYYIASVVNLHARWLDMPAADRPLHPLAPLVQAWQRGRCVLDAKPRVLFGADLIGDRLDAEDEAAMLKLATTAEPDGPDTAPMLDFGVRDPAGLVPPYLLDAYRAGGGASVSRGRGGPAPVRQRLWLHGLTAIEPTDRTGDMRRFGPLAIGKHLIDHLWPYGWDYRRSDWPSLLNAIRAVNRQPLLYQGPGGVLKEVHLIAFTDYPVTAPDPRALRAATFRGVITLPEGMARGPSLARAALEHAGMLSGPAQRLVVAWAFYRGRYLSRATPKERRFTAPTIPRARRDEQGRYLDADGSVILDKRGRPLERFTDPRVVLLDAAGEPVAKLDQAARDRNPRARPCAGMAARPMAGRDGIPARAGAGIVGGADGGDEGTAAHRGRVRRATGCRHRRLREAAGRTLPPRPARRRGQGPRPARAPGGAPAAARRREAEAPEQAARPGRAGAVRRQVNGLRFSGPRVAFLGAKGCGLGAKGCGAVVSPPDSLGRFEVPERARDPVSVPVRIRGTGPGPRRRPVPCRRLIPSRRWRTFPALKPNLAGCTFPPLIRPGRGGDPPMHLSRGAWDPDRRGPEGPSTAGETTACK